MDFLRQNAGKLGLVAVLLIAAIAIYSFAGGGGTPSRSGKVQFVCVATGETFWLERKPRILPVENPDTGQKTLVPCHEKEDGTISISTRIRSVVEQLEKDGINKYINPETLTVRAEP